MTSPINELELQRCVDGELPLAQRRELIEQLEQNIGGWKTLALAFLEAQEFNAASAEFRDGPAAAPSVIKSVRETAGPRTAFPLVAQSLALAASVGVAFWLGTRTGGNANVELADKNRPSAATGAANDETPKTYRPDDSNDSTSLASNNASRGPQPTAVLKLPFTGAGDEELEIPVYDQRKVADDDGPEIPLVWPSNDKSTALSSSGYRVTSEKNLLSIPLETGATVYVPVEVSGVTYAVQ